jgi:hypothetical protein
MSRLGHRMMRAVASLMLFIVTPSTVVGQQIPIEELVSIERELNGMCRGWSGDSDHTGQVCALRDKFTATIRKNGYCYGKKGQAGYQMSWHRCTPTSNR